MPENLAKWYMQVFTYLFGSLVFWIKMTKEGLCHFTFDEQGFSRQSRSGKSQLSWDGLKAFIVCTGFYVLEGKRKGMAPIPKRCLTETEQKQLEGFAVNKLVIAE